MADDWDQHRLHVTSTLDRLEDKVDLLVTDVAKLKARAALWGAMAGVLVSTLVSIVVALIA